MRLGFHRGPQNVSIFISTGNLHFSLIIPDSDLRTPEGRAILDNFLIGTATTPGVNIPYPDVERLLDEIDLNFPVRKKRDTPRFKLF